MSFGSLARAAAAAFAAALVSAVSATGCTADPEAAPAGYCDVAKASAERCKEPTDCDATLVNGCASLERVVGSATLSAARDCLESGVCGPASCLSRAQKNVQPSGAHRELAVNYCTSCAPGVAGCEAQFYARTGRLPGLLVLPYTEDVVRAVDDACTGTDGCQAKFATCASEVIARTVAERLDEGIASCLVQGFTQDEGEGGRRPGGSAHVATCTKENCAGCCRDDRCEEGTSVDACGAGAAACQVCAGAQKCTAGQCKEPCGPNNCAGCCDGDTCIAGTANDKCGGDGAACASCSGSFVCSNKTCIDGSCRATCTNGCCSQAGCQPGTAANACGVGGEACVDCGFGRACRSGACVIDPEALWDVYVSFAVLPEKNKSGEAWDPLNGAPDAYLVAYSSEGSSTHAGQTTPQTDSTFPFWAETPLKGVKARELLNNFSVDLWDADRDFDDYIGGCTIKLDPAIFDGSLQDRVCPPSSIGVSVKVYFRINPPK